MIDFFLISNLLVFEDGFDSLQKALELCLDDFIHKDNVIVANELKELSLCVSAPSELSAKRLDWYYSLSIHNLKKSAPNLKSLELNGGYVYFPKKTVKFISFLKI